MNLEEVWHKAQTQLTEEDFHFWLCFAYGAMKAHIESETNVSTAEDLAEVLNGRIENIKREGRS